MALPHDPEGVVKYRCEHVRRRLRPQPGLDELVRWRAELRARGLVGADGAGLGYGNLSVRLYSSPRFLISGSQTGGLAAVDPRHFAEVLSADLDRNFVRCAGEVSASSEALTHAALYQADAATRGVVHVHSTPLWERLRNRLPTTREDVAYGTPEMGYEMIRLRRKGALGPQGVIVMGGHRDGLVAFAPSLAQAVGELLGLLGGG